MQRLSYFVSLAAYLALAALWLPAVSLNLLAGSALTRGYMKIGETAHYELLTMDIYTRALRCIVRPGHTAFKEAA